MANQADLVDNDPQVEQQVLDSMLKIKEISDEIPNNHGDMVVLHTGKRDDYVEPTLKPHEQIAEAVNQKIDEGIESARLAGEDWSSMFDAEFRAKRVREAITKNENDVKNIPYRLTSEEFTMLEDAIRTSGILPAGAAITQANIGFSSDRRRIESNNLTVRIEFRASMPRAVLKENDEKTLSRSGHITVIMDEGIYEGQPYSEVSASGNSYARSIVPGDSEEARIDALWEEANAKFAVGRGDSDTIKKSDRSLVDAIEIIARNVRFRVGA